MQFDVTNLNYVSQADDVPLVPTVILFVAFSENGDWMTTVSKSSYCSFSALSESFTYCSSCRQWGTIRVHSVYMQCTYVCTCGCTVHMCVVTCVQVYK